MTQIAMSLQDKHCVAARRLGISGWWITVFLLWLGWVFMDADRTVLTAVIEDHQSGFRLTATQLGLASSVSFLSHAVMQVPAGFLGDHIGRKKPLAPGFLLLGVFTAGTKMAKSPCPLIAAWVISGAGEGTYYRPQFGISSEQVPPHHRSLGSAVINSSMAFGIALGLMASSYMGYTLNWGWRLPFILTALPTVVTGLLIWFLIKENPRPSGSAAVARQGAFPHLLKNRNLLIVDLMVFCSLFRLFSIVTWRPYHLQTERGIPAREIGNSASLAARVSIPGGLLFARISNQLDKR